jgi:mannose-6-phosphate isomerase
MFLFEAIALDPAKILGAKHIKLHAENLGMLIKFLDAQTQYTLQAHPTRPFAKKMWNSDFGKEESWYVIGTRDDTKEGAYILLGFKEGVTRKDLETYCSKDDMKAMENLCHKIPVHPGDVFFVGGGLVHALGEGCFVIEVQEPSDITVVPVRKELLEKERGRVIPDDEALYNEKVFGAFSYDGCTYEENLRRWKIPHRLIRQGDWGKEYFLIGPGQTSFFSFTQADIEGTADIIKTGFPQVGIVLKGKGEILYQGGKMAVSRGDEIFFPYDIPNAKAEGKLSIVFCHPEGADPSADYEKPEGRIINRAASV